VNAGDDPDAVAEVLKRMADDDVGIDVPAHTAVIQVTIPMVISRRGSCIPTTSPLTFLIKMNSRI